MITTSKVLLVCKEFDELNTNYEAITKLKSFSEIDEVWRNNKTPIINKKDLITAIARKYPILKVPDFIFGPENFIAFCHRNGVECGEYCTKKKYDTSKEKCFLCEIASYTKIKEEAKKFNAVCKDVSDMIIYESKHFFVKIELGCLTPGMLMICPKNHYLSAAQIPDEEMKEYETVMEDVEFILQSTYGKEGTVIFFEHGSAPSGFSSHQRSIVHAHTHVAWGVRFDKKYLDMVCLEKVRDIRSLKTEKYLSYQEGAKGDLYAVWNPNVYVQRQYPRQIIGLMVGIDNEKCNWRVERFDDNMNKTFYDLYFFLSQYRVNKSDRITHATDCFVNGYPERTDLF